MTGQHRVIATVQVRMGSSRLQGKTLLEINGQPLLGHLLDRLERTRRLNGVVVATPIGPDNDPVEQYCQTRGIACYRGSEDDVLDRMLKAVQWMRATIGVEVFGDCPLIDPAIVDAMVDAYVDADGALDFIGNDLTTTYPPGMEVEVFSVAALEDSARRASDPAVREHGTLFIRQNPSLYRIRNVEAPPHHHHPDLELEIDAPEDVPVISAIIRQFSGKPDFTLDDVIAFMGNNPALTKLNTDVPRRWKVTRTNG